MILERESAGPAHRFGLVFVKHRQRRLIAAELFPNNVFRREVVCQRAPRNFLPGGQNSAQM